MQRVNSFDSISGMYPIFLIDFGRVNGLNCNESTRSTSWGWNVGFARIFSSAEYDCGSSHLGPRIFRLFKHLHIFSIYV